ncbi:MAG TPA: hypothetical protein VGK29_15530 [Paludibaculum sp.]|jgi:hypothetical protein
MIPKLAAAFVVGGIAVGSIMWLARPKTEPQAAPVEVAQALPRTEPPRVEVPPEPVSIAPPAQAPAPRSKAKTVAPAKPVQAAKVTRESAQPERPADAHGAAPASQPVAAPAPAPEPVARHAEPAPPPPPAILKPSKDVSPAQPRQPQTVTIPAGTMITVRLRDTLRASSASTDDPFHATLDQPLIVDGMVLAERGTAQRGRVTESVAAGRVKGRAALTLELTQLVTSDGQKIDIHTESYRKEAASGLKSDAAKAGVMAGIGAAIGAMAGGGKGAAIGAGVGGAAGAGTVLATKGQDAEIPSETRLTFRLKDPVTLTEKLN